MADVSDPYAAAMAQAVSDAAFRQLLIADPVATMRAAGMAVPKGVTVKVVENTDALVHLVLPAVGVHELTDQALEAVVGGRVHPVGGNIMPG
jgi:hypothetical protein